MNRSLALALLLAPSLALAQRTYIEVGSPNFQPLPIAVSTFRADGGNAQVEATELYQVVRNDLWMSGFFDVLDPKAFLADAGEGMLAPMIRFSRWADVGADGLVKAVVRQAPAGVEAEFHLYEVRAGREVLSKTYRAPVTAARQIAHTFADDVIQYYTREPGVFRTRVLAVRKVGLGREIVAFDVDGARPQVLYRDASLVLLPTWRPDGKGILFTAYRNGRPELWSFDLNNRHAQRVIAVGDITTGGVYSPDGQRIAFAASVQGNSDIWVANADGSGARRLTTDPGIDGSPTWAPDGKRIAFVSNRGGNPHLYVMNADGSGQRRLTFQGNYNTTPRWSPRGDVIAFTARDERRVFDIFTIAVDTGKIQRVTQDQGSTNEEPTWAPNGRLLAFDSDRQGRAQLVISNPTGDRQTVITRDGNELVTPAWGPLPQ